MLHEVNPYVELFRQAKEFQSLNPTSNVRLRISCDRKSVGKTITNYMIKLSCKPADF